MGLDTSGFLLEGVRVATGNNAFTYPPRSVVSGSVISGTGRSEYLIIVSGQRAGQTGIDIGDPNLRLKWSRNDVASRFDYNGFDRRWAPMPGGAPEALGKLGNSPRLAAPLPQDGATSPYALYLGYPARFLTFTLVEVASADDFGSVASGVVQISRESGELNFSQTDVDDPALQGETVYLNRQSFFDRQKTKGRIGELPDSSGQSYNLFVSPVPGAGESPLIRIGYRSHLSVQSYANESSLSTPSAGICAVALDTGKIIFSPDDINSFPGDPVYYDGVILGEKSLTRHEVAGINPSDPRTAANLIGLSSSTRYVFFVSPPGAPAASPRYYFQAVIVDSGSLFSTPPAGYIYIDPEEGKFTLNSEDITVAGGAKLEYVDTHVVIDRDVAIQLYVSGVNTSGFPQVADFTEFYSVQKQLLQDGITQSPFVLLPTVPTVDSSIKFIVRQGEGGGGTYVGDLVDGADSTKPGLGYILDLDNKQLKFCFRKTVSLTVDKSLPSVKLPDAAISEDGLVLKKNGTAIQPGVGFDFTPATGLLEFIEPVGENDPLNVFSVAGQCASPNIFISSKPVFTSSHIGKYIYIASGTNAGFYEIVQRSDNSRVYVQPPFKSFGSESAEVRADREIIADRWWTKVPYALKKISIYRLKSVTDTEPVKLTEDEFSVSPSTGQINFTKPTKMGEVYRAVYVSLDTEDEGVTVTPTNRSELAAFKIRQELATTTSGSASVKFNPSQDTVSIDHPIAVYVDGVTQEDGSFTFAAPDTIVLNRPMLTESVVIDYWVRESPGGNRGFKVLHTSVDVDYPTITGTDSGVADPVTSLNGDLRSIVQPDSAILSDGKDVFLVREVSYDPSTDVTSVKFSPAPSVTIINPPLQVCAPVGGTYQTTEGAAFYGLPKGHNSFDLQGSLPYRSGTVVVLDKDPYLVLAATFNAQTNKTSVVLAASASRNYILPQITRSVRPVFASGSEFATAKLAHGGYPITLVVEGPSPRTLRPKTDFNVGEGGVIKLETSPDYNDRLSVMYVARSSLPVGTVIEANYAHAIAPNQTNGLLGQKLYGSYNLYSPDTFFYRIETIQSYLPEFLEELKKSASTSSGPNTNDKKSLQSKDMGMASLYFSEQHQANNDVIVQRLLKFYNDFINLYEDLLANLDGRVVGGSSGRFRYDGLLDNPPRADYASITNDIDDESKLFDAVAMTGFFTFSDEPTYARMYNPNNLSRIFSTSRQVTVFLNDKVDLIDFGKTLGSIKINNLTSVGVFSTTPASAAFTAQDGSNVLSIPKNGDSDNLIPKFSFGQPVLIYDQDGTPLGTSTVVIATDTSITLADSVPTTRGSIVTDVANASPKYYTPDRDLSVNYDNGQISNFHLPPPFDEKQEEIIGNELVDTVVTFSNPDTTPKRIPVLDGSTLSDSGRISYPRLTYKNETDLLAFEANTLSTMGKGFVASDLITVTGYEPLVAIGDKVTFIDGPNGGLQRTVTMSIVVEGKTVSFTVDAPWAAEDSVGSLIQVHQVDSSNWSASLDSLVEILETSVATGAVAPALIGKLASEYLTVKSLIECAGPTIIQGIGSASGDVLTVVEDLSATNSPITNSCILCVPTGANAGVYKVAEVSNHEITVDTTSPYSAFPSASSTEYFIIQPWSFLTDKIFKGLSEFMVPTRTFLEQTKTWKASPSAGGLPGRVALVTGRQAQISGFIQSITDILTRSGKLYDQRYLWIKQRTDKKDGIITLRERAKEKRLSDTTKLLEDQQKLLITSQLASN